jgi:hypothetical protein
VANGDKIISDRLDELNFVAVDDPDGEKSGVPIGSYSAQTHDTSKSARHKHHQSHTN